MNRYSLGIIQYGLMSHNDFGAWVKYTDVKELLKKVKYFEESLQFSKKTSEAFNNDRQTKEEVIRILFDETHLEISKQKELFNQLEELKNVYLRRAFLFGFLFFFESFVVFLLNFY